MVTILNQTIAESKKKDEIIERFAAENMQLKHELYRLKKLVFSSKSERFQEAASADQLSLAYSNMVVTLNYLSSLGEVNDERLREFMPEL